MHVSWSQLSLNIVEFESTIYMCMRVCALPRLDSNALNPGGRQIL